MPLEHGAARKQADQVALAVSKPDIAAHPYHVVGNITDLPAALRDNLGVVPRKECFDDRASAREETVRMASLRHPLARSVGSREGIAFKQGDRRIEIRQCAGGQKPTHAGTDNDCMFAQLLHGNPPVQSLRWLQ